MKPLLIVLLALGLSATALAQTEVRRTPVYRCGPDGRDLRDSPCPGGAPASAVDYDEPSGVDSRAARDRQLAEARQAAALAQARRASEAEARQQRAQSLGLQPRPAPAASAPHVVRVRPPLAARPHRVAPPASAAR